MRLLRDQSLFQQSALRLTSSEKVAFAPHMTMTNSEFRFVVGEQLHSVGLQPGPILIEPEGKNTAPAIAAAAWLLARKTPDAIMLVLPSDHAISDQQLFDQKVARSRKQKKGGPSQNAPTAHAKKQKCRCDKPVAIITKCCK